LLVSFVIALLFLKTVHDPKVFRLLVLAFTTRIIVMLLDYYEIVSIPGSGDVEGFHSVASDNQNSTDITVFTNYTVLLTYIYRLTDCSKLLAQYVNVMMGMIFLYFLNKTLKLVKADRKTHLVILIIAAIMPNLIFFAAILLREAWIEMFLMMSIYYYVRWFLGVGKTTDAVLSILYVFCATWMHSGCVVVVLGYMLGFFVYNRRTKAIQFSNSFVPVMTMVVIMALFLISNADSFLGKFGHLGDSATEDMMVDVYTAKVEAGSTYLDWLTVTTPAQAVLFAPLKMFYFLFSPIPLDWRNLMDAIAFLLDSTVYIFLFYQIIKRKSHSPERRYLIRFLLVSFFLATFVFAFGTIASGTAVRHRAKIVAILFVCYGLTGTNNQNKTKDYNLCVQ